MTSEILVKEDVIIFIYLGSNSNEDNDCRIDDM